MNAAPTVAESRGTSESTGWATVSIASRRHLTDWVDEFRFESADGSPLPAWTPGSHIDVQIPECTVPGRRCWGDDDPAEADVDSLIRQYSLCSDPDDLSGYTIAVDRTPIDRGGRGGSERIHQTFDPGALVRIGAPRNHFALQRASNYVFIAGGIGIAPIIPLIAQADQSGRPWTLLCLAQSEEDMPYYDELIDTWGAERVSIHTSGTCGRIDFAEILADQPRGTAVYVCGPGTMAMSVRMVVDPQPAVDVFTEQFSAPIRLTGDGDRPFEVTVASTGGTLTVPADRSVLDTLEECGVSLAASCREGMCGTCEAEVVSGEVEHRDTVLTPEERAENDSMMVCVSRCSSGRLVLDL